MSNGIDFVIGGKDQAKPAMSAVEKSLERLEQKTAAVEKSTASLAAITKTVAVAYGLVKTALAALGGLDKINAAYEGQTKAVKNLNSALAARGAASSAQSQQMQTFAADLQKLTGVGDEVTIGLMQQAASMGFATDRIDDATKAAVGLADVTGKSLEASLSDVKDALQGNFDAFYQLNPRIMYMRTNQEKLNAVMQIAQQGLQQQSQNINSTAGASLRAAGAFGDLLESIGAIIAPIRVLISAGIQQASESLNALLTPAVQYATEILQNLGPVVEWVKEKVVAAVNIMVGAFTFVETVVTNLSSVWDLAAAYAERAMISISESVMHTLTEVVPEYAKWFAANFVNLIRDAFNAVITVITNAGRIIGETVYQIFAFIASGGAGGIDQLMANMGHAASISLMDGFKSSLTSLPEIADRQLTQREKDLLEKIGAIGGRLGKEFSDKMQERMVGVGSTLSDELNAGASQFNLQGRPAVQMQGIPVTEGRLLTRGPGTRLPDMLQEIIRLLKDPPAPKPPKQKILVQLDRDQMKVWDDIQQNTANNLQMEAIA